VSVDVMKHSQSLSLAIEATQLPDAHEQQRFLLTAVEWGVRRASPRAPQWSRTLPELHLPPAQNTIVLEF
jgi:hypothetical protein